MVDKLHEIIDDYEKRLQEMPFIPRSSYAHRMLWEDGGPNRDFLTYLLCDHGFTMQFLGRDMMWSAEPSNIPIEERQNKLLLCW